MNDTELLELKIDHLDKDFMSIIKDLNDRLNRLEDKILAKERMTKFPNDKDIVEMEDDIGSYINR